MNLFLYSNLLLPEHHEKLFATFQLKKPRIVVIPAQSGPKTQYYFEKIQQSFKSLPTESIELVSIDAEMSKEKVSEKLKLADVILLSGGNTFYFLNSAKSFQIKVLLLDAINRKAVIAGQSAGAIILTPTIKTAALLGDQAIEGVEDLTGLNLIDFEFFPHFDENKHNNILLDYSKTTSPAIYALPENAALALKDNKQILFGRGKLFKDGNQQEIEMSS